MKASSIRQAKYDAKHVKGIYLKLNITTDKDILTHLNKVNNKQGYIKQLIRNDIKLNPSE